MSRRDSLWFYALGVEMAARNGRDPILLCWYLGFKQFRGSGSSREPVGVAGVAVGFSLPPETCLQFLHLCSETRALPEQHGKEPCAGSACAFPRNERAQKENISTVHIETM